MRRTRRANATPGGGSKSFTVPPNTAATQNRDIAREDEDNATVMTHMEEDLRAISSAEDTGAISRMPQGAASTSARADKRIRESTPIARAVGLAHRPPLSLEAPPQRPGSPPAVVVPALVACYTHA